MVKNCCVVHCSNRCNANARERGISFFRFPKDKRQRRAWIKSINRKDWTPNDNSWICSEHFIGGWRGYERRDENYAPTLFPHKKKDVQQHRERSARCQKETEMEEPIVEERENAMKNMSLMMHSSYCTDKQLKKVESKGSQTDPDPLLQENLRLKRELLKLKDEVERVNWGIHKIKDNDYLTNFYTGLPSFATFLWLFKFLLPKSGQLTNLSESSSSSLTNRSRASKTMLQPIDQLFAVLMRNKLGLFVQDVSDRFEIPCATFSKYYLTWLSLLHSELKLLNPFPSREIVQRTMPSPFKEKYPSTRIIIDCTEISIQCASSSTNQSSTFSNYKNINTLKFLVGVSPAGVISFVSEAWGGGLSDRKITEESGLLDLLEAGDSVMADKEFTITDLLEERQCGLNIPPVHDKSHQLTTKQVQLAQEIAELRSQVEQSIAKVKQFHVFDGILAPSFAPIATKLFQVCCWLTNFDYTIVWDK